MRTYQLDNLATGQTSTLSVLEYGHVIICPPGVPPTYLPRERAARAIRTWRDAADREPTRYQFTRSESRR